MKHSGRRSRLASVAVASPLLCAALAASACSSGSSSSSGPSTTGPVATAKPPRSITPESLPDGTEIEVLDNRFDPEASIVAVGRPVVFENVGRNDHNVLPVEPGAFTPIEVEQFHPGDDATIVFDKPGTYEIYCSVHGNKEAGMVGTIVVR